MTKLTKKRQQIYNILKKESKPLSAEEIYAKLKNDDMNLSTVYRALEKFYDDGLASRNHIEHTAYYFLNADEHHHFMICSRCGKKFEFDCHLEELIQEIDRNYHFKVVHHDLNLYGICQMCQ